MTKRGHGEGTIYKDLSRNRWVMQVSYKTADGETKRRKFTGKTKRIALDKSKNWMQNLAGGLSPESDKITVEYWIDRWLEDFVKPSVRVKTYEKYLSCMKNYVKPRFTGVLLARLTVPDVQKALNELIISGGKASCGISALTVRNTRRYLIAALDKAIEVGYLLKNVAKLTDPPKVKKKEIKPLNKEQAKCLLQVACETDRDVYAAINIALATGMRIGEVMGLQWQDIDFTRKIITVKRSRVNSNHGVRIEEPKTGVMRNIPVNQSLISALKVHQKRQERQKDIMGSKYIDNNWVIGGSLGCNYDPSYFSSRKVNPVFKKAGIDWDFSFHDLRHTHATLLLIAGINPKIVQERLGHSTIQVTLDTYSHLLPDTQAVAVSAVEDFMAT